MFFILDVSTANITVHGGQHELSVSAPTVHFY